MDSIQIEDENGLLWTVRIKPGTGVGGGPDGKYAKPGPPVLEFCHIKEIVAPRQTSYISNFSIEELKKLLKKLQQSKP